MALTSTRNFPKLLTHCNKQAGTYFSINASLCFHHYLNINLEDSGLRQTDTTLYFIPVFLSYQHCDISKLVNFDAYLFETSCQHYSANMTPMNIILTSTQTLPNPKYKIYHFALIKKIKTLPWSIHIKLESEALFWEEFR